MKLLWIFVYGVIFPFVISSTYHNLTEWNSHRRTKRTLIYETAGLSKMVLGITLPCPLGDKKPWRTLNVLWNIQAQYMVPTKVQFTSNAWTGRTLKSSRNQYEKDGVYIDQSTKFLYTTLEIYHNRTGKNGRECMQRLICENAQNMDTTDNLYAQILQRAFTPGKSDHQDYLDAYAAGKHGVNCLSLYFKCPYGDGIFEKLLVNDNKK